MKYTQFDEPPQRRRGIIMLPVDEGWTASWFDFLTSDRNRVKIEPKYTQGEPWRFGALSGVYADQMESMEVSFYGADGELVTLQTRPSGDGSAVSVWCVGDAVETIRLLTQDGAGS